MSMMTKIVAPLLRIGGAFAGVMAVYLVSDDRLVEGLAAAGLSGIVSLAMTRLAAHVAGGMLGFVIASQVAGLALRGPRTPPGTREDAAEAVPRLRRHLVEGQGSPRGSSMPDYLDPDPAPTKPVGVSFKELGLEHPHASEYPMPGGEAGHGGDDFAFRDDRDRPESAGSASDEWGEPAPQSDLPRAAPPAPPEPAMTESSDVESVEEASVESQEHEEERFFAGAMPLPVSMDGVVDGTSDGMKSDESDAPDVAEAPGPGPEDSSRPVTADQHREPEEPVSDDSYRPEPVVPQPAAAPPVPDDYSRVSFAMPSATGDADWYDGAGDEEEDAEDDGAGYGSLASIGLGKNHAPRVDTGQRGEAGLPPAQFAASGPSVVPKGKPQDFRLREALAELQRLDEIRR